MLRSALRTAALWLLLYVPGGPALAESIAPVIGNGHYDTLPVLDNPNRDAIAMAGRLQDPGFQVTPVFDAGAGELNRLADRFVASAKGADIALVYFAGHGVQLFDRNFLLGRDFDLAKAKRPADLGLDLSGVVDKLKHSGAIRHAILVDACRSNPLDINETVALLRQLSPEADAPTVKARSRGLAPFTLARSQSGDSETLMFFAAQPGAVSLDGSGQNSFFVEGLKQALAKADRPVGEVFRDASVYVRAATGGQQIPQVVSGWTSDPTIGANPVAHVEYDVAPAKYDRPLADGERRQIIAAAEKNFRLPRETSSPTPTQPSCERSRGVQAARRSVRLPAPVERSGCGTGRKRGGGAVHHANLLRRPDAQHCRSGNPLWAINV